MSASDALDQFLSPALLRAALAQSFTVGIPGPEAGEADLNLVAKEGLGGIILFARNVRSPAQIWELNYRLRRAAAEADRPPLFVMVDQEGGRVARLKDPFTHLPSFEDLGAGSDAAGVCAHAARVGRELAAAGFNWNLAPVVDVDAVAGGVQKGRCLSSDPDRVGRLAAAYIDGLQGAGCLACAKHFPGLGRTVLDTHQVRPVVELSRTELDAVELPPFRRAAEAGVSGVMVCHAVFAALDPDRPASLSPLVIDGLLRDELGFQGLVVSDDLEMGAVAGQMGPDEAGVAAYLAGCDVILVCHRPELALAAVDRLTEMVLAGEVPPDLVRQKLGRVLAAKRRLAALPPPIDELRALLDNK